MPRARQRAAYVAPDLAWLLHGFGPPSCYLEAGGHAARPALRGYAALPGSADPVVVLHIVAVLPVSSAQVKVLLRWSWFGRVYELAAIIVLECPGSRPWSAPKRMAVGLPEAFGELRMRMVLHKGPYPGGRASNRI